jgi:glucokinase
MRISAVGEILAREIVDTPADDPVATVAAIVRVAEALTTPDVRVVGVGVAGMVEAGTGVLRYSPNLAWREVPVAEQLGRATGLPCLVDNDANVAAWGEFRFGAGRGHRHLLLVTVGTGIGGGVIADGLLFRGAHGFAAEIGHIVVEPGGPVCGCGNRGCWEQVAAGRAIDRLGRAAVVDHPTSVLSQLVEGRAELVEGPLVTEAARRGDDVARAILAEVGRRLGEGIGSLVNVLDPEVVLVGGGAAEAGELLLGSAREALYETIEAPDHRPEVPLLPAELGPEAGAIGAAALALDELMRR